MPKPPVLVLRDAGRLADLIERRGVSKRSVARAAGYETHAYLHYLLTGQRSTLRVDAAEKIAEYLGVTVGHLFKPHPSRNRGRHEGTAA